MEKRIQEYITKWKRQGYSTGIPDEIPLVLMRSNLAPSYKSIALAILKNDHYMVSLGFSSKKTKWYDVLKKIELKQRGVIKDSGQLYFNFGSYISRDLINSPLTKEIIIVQSNNCFPEYLFCFLFCLNFR